MHKQMLMHKGNFMNIFHEYTLHKILYFGIFVAPGGPNRKEVQPRRGKGYPFTSGGMAPPAGGIKYNIVSYNIF